MDKDYSIFETNAQEVKGKWNYAGYTKDLWDILDSYKVLERDDKMPKYLIFGQNAQGTDLKTIFTYNCGPISKIFYLQGQYVGKNDNDYLDDGYNHINFNFFFVGNNMVVYRTDDKNDNIFEKRVFYIYNRLDEHDYTNIELQKLLDKFSSQELDDPCQPFDIRLIGEWKLYDLIKESEEPNYDGIQREKEPFYMMGKLFTILDIQQKSDWSADVYIMKEGDEYGLKNRHGVFNFNRDNTILEMKMSRKVIDGFIIYDRLRGGQRLHGFYKVINSKEYLFVDLDNSPDIDQDYYVFKRTDERIIEDPFNI